MKTYALRAIPFHLYPSHRDLCLCIERGVILVDCQFVCFVRREEIGGVYFDITLLCIGHYSHIPFVARAPCLTDPFSRLTIEGTALVPHRGALFPEVELLAHLERHNVIPEEELHRAIVYCRHGQLVGLGILHTTFVIAQCVVARAAEKACEGQCDVVCGVGHLLVAHYSLLRHEVRVCTAPASRTVFVVDIDHQPVFRAPFDGIVKPCCPHLGAYLHEAELYTFNSPLAVEGQDGVELIVERTLVDVDPYANTLVLGILTQLCHGEIPFGADGECR